MKEFLINGNVEKFNIKAENYSLKHRVNSLGRLTHKDITISNSSGIILQYKGLDSAVLGYEMSNDLMKCESIQGGIRRFRELVAIEWHKVLLNEAINIALRDKITTTISIPSARPEYQKVQGLDYKNIERLIKRYDLNALFFGFTLDEKTGLYTKKI